MNSKTKTKPSDDRCVSQGVCLELTRPEAQEVCIAGAFNDWHPSVTPMIRLSDGKWAKELVLPPGRYEYRFVVDGQWVDDPKAAALVPNPFGSANAVLVVAEAQPAGRAVPAKAAQSKRSRSTL